MTARKPMLLTPLFLVACTSALAGYAAYQEPDGLVAFLAAMFLLPLAWAIIELRQRAETGAIAEYAQIEETFAPGALTLISDWINERFESHR